MPCTPTEFCAVIAVSTLIPWTPWASIVFRSAWIPAPPPESEPAMVSTRAVGRVAQSAAPRDALAGTEVVPAGGAVPGLRRPPAPAVRRRPPGPADRPASPRAARHRPGNVAARAWSSPPVSSSAYGSIPVAAPTAWSGSGTSKASRRRSITTPEASRHVAQIGQQAVRDVDHRRRAGRRGRCPAAVRHLGHPVRLHRGARRAKTSTEHGQPGRGPARPAEQGHHVAGPGPRPQHDPAAARRPEHRHRNGDVAGSGQVAADQADPGPRRLLAQAGRELERPPGRQVARRRETDHDRVRPSLPSPRCRRR